MHGTCGPFEQSVYITRLYVTRGIKLASRDANGLADPFLVVSNGKHKQNIIDDIQNTHYDTTSPNFYRCYELPTMVPGNPTLTIEVWDKDSQGAQLIGATSIDIESRLLSQEWIEMAPKPVERRYLWSPASLAPQGKLELWVEILTPPQALASKPKVLRAPALLECQLRVVVWSVTELEIRGKSDDIEYAVRRRAPTPCVYPVRAHTHVHPHGCGTCRVHVYTGTPTRPTSSSQPRRAPATPSAATCTSARTRRPTSTGDSSLRWPNRRGTRSCRCRCGTRATPPPTTRSPR